MALLEPKNASGGKRGRKRKIVARPDSPARALTVMAENAEACMDSLRAAVDHVEEGKWAEAISAVGGAQRSHDGVSSTWMENVVLALKGAEAEQEKILARMNR